MCEYCENPNNTIVKHLIGVSAFVGAGRLLLRFYDEELDITIVTGANIHYCAKNTGMFWRATAGRRSPKRSNSTRN